MTQEVVGFFVREIAEAEDLADFAGREKFAELQREEAEKRKGLVWYDLIKACLRLVGGGGGKMGLSSYFGWYVLGTPISLAPELLFWMEGRASGVGSFVQALGRG